MTLPILHLGIGHGSCPDVSLRHRRLLARALEEGFLAGRVVRRVHDVDNLRGHPAHHDLEPLSQGYGTGGATWPASAHDTEEAPLPNGADCVRSARPDRGRLPLPL